MWRNDPWPPHAPRAQGSQDWLRVVAVVTNGEEWEFQGLNWWEEESHQNLLTFKYRRIECKFEDDLNFWDESIFLDNCTFLFKLQN